MANTFKFGNGNWAVKDGYALAYNDENNNFKPLPFDFTRASSATRVNKQGLIETVGSGKPRIDFLNNTDGHLLLEPSRTNKLIRSNEFNIHWTLGSALNLTSGQTSALTGNNNAWLLSSNGSSGFSALTNNVSFSGEHTYSIFAKKGTNDKISLRSLSGTDARAEFNLNTGSLVATSNTTSTKIQNYGNGWYRVSMTFTATNTNVYVYPNPIGTADVGNIYIQNSQLEAGSYPTSYVKTKGSSVTRVSDLCNGAESSNVFNSSEGAIIIELQALVEGDTASRRITLSARNSSNRILLETDELAGVFKFFIAGGGTVRTIVTSYNNTQIDVNKIAVNYDGTNAQAYINGTQVGSITNATTRTGIDTFDFADWNGTANVYYGKIRSVKVYDTALSDSELQNLTS